MIQIRIDWTFISPSLQIISGKLSVFDVKYDWSTSEPILKCNVKKEGGTTSFESIEQGGFDSGLFELLKDKIDDMIHSYWKGMKLRPRQWSWVEDTLNTSVDDWIKKREKYLSEVKHQYGMELARRKEEEKQSRATQIVHQRSL